MRMDDALAERRDSVEDVTDGDAVATWRRLWEHDVASAEATCGETSDLESPQSAMRAHGDARGEDAQVAVRRRDYGTYLFVGLDIVLAFIGQIVLSIPLIVLLAALFLLTGHRFVLNGRINAELATWLQLPQFTLLSLLATDGAMLLVLWYRLRRLRLGWSLFGLGAPLRSNVGRSVLTGLAVGLGAVVVAGTIAALLQRLGLDQSGQDKLLIEPLKHAPAWVIVGMILAGTFVAPVVEELFFRGYLFRALAVRKGLPLAYVLSAGVFAAFHLIPNLVPVLFVVGLLLCFAYQRTGNLLGDITAHAFFNGVNFSIALLPTLLHHH